MHDFKWLLLRQVCTIIIPRANDFFLENFISPFLNQVLLVRRQRKKPGKETATPPHTHRHVADKASCREVHAEELLLLRTILHISNSFCFSGNVMTNHISFGLTLQYLNQNNISQTHLFFVWLTFGGFVVGTERALKDYQLHRIPQRLMCFQVKFSTSLSKIFWQCKQNVNIVQGFVSFLKSPAFSMLSFPDNVGFSRPEGVHTDRTALSGSYVTTGLPTTHSLVDSKMSWDTIPGSTERSTAVVADQFSGSNMPIASSLMNTRAIWDSFQTSTGPFNQPPQSQSSMSVLPPPPPSNPSLRNQLDHRQTNLSVGGSVGGSVIAAPAGPSFLEALAAEADAQDQLRHRLLRMSSDDDDAATNPEEDAQPLSSRGVTDTSGQLQISVSQN